MTDVTPVVPRFNPSDLLNQVAGSLLGSSKTAKEDAMLVPTTGYKDTKTGKMAYKTVKQMATQFVNDLFDANSKGHAGAAAIFQPYFNAGVFGSKFDKQSVYSKMREIYLDAAQQWDGGKGKPVDPYTNFNNQLAIIAQYTGRSAAAQVQQTVSSFTDAEATALAKSQYQTVFGRSPSNKEVTDFKKALIAAAQANPTITKMVIGKGGKQIQTTMGGFDAKAWIASYMAGKLPAEASKADLMGDAGSNQDLVRNMANAYGLKISNQNMFDTVRGLLDGSITKDSLQQQYQGQAKARFGSAMAAAIDAGNTVEQVVNPFLTTYAKLMEQNQDSLKVSDIADMATAVENGQQRLLTENEFAAKVRQQPGWLSTGNAKEEAAGLGNSLLRMFGLVK